ncbi:hypothetical protein HK096_006096 [Nowakowskiella sp. JEL0078]|nr:hypothetical protein HK096_006096 [Nowakowskiella sp. JEL0078]
MASIPLFEPTKAIGPWGEQWESMEEFGFPGFVRTDIEGEILTPPALRCLLDSACLMARKLEPENQVQAKKFGYHVNVGLYIEDVRICLQYILFFITNVRKISWMKLRLDPVTFALAVGLDVAEKQRQEKFLSKLKALYLIGFAEADSISFKDFLPRTIEELTLVTDNSSKQFDSLIRQKKEDLNRRVRSVKKEDVERLGVWGRIPKNFDDTTIQHTVNNWKVVVLPDRQLRPHVNIRFSANFTPTVAKTRRSWESLEDLDEKDLLCEELVNTWSEELKFSEFVQVEVQGSGWASSGPPTLHLRAPHEDYLVWLKDVCKVQVDLWNGGWNVVESKKFMELDGCQYARDDMGLLMDALGIQRPPQQTPRRDSRHNIHHKNPPKDHKDE